MPLAQLSRASRPGEARPCRKCPPNPPARVGSRTAASCQRPTASKSFGDGGGHCPIHSEAGIAGVLSRPRCCLLAARRRAESPLTVVPRRRLNGGGGGFAVTFPSSSSTAQSSTRLLPSGPRRSWPRVTSVYSAVRALATSPSTVESAPSRLRDPASELGGASRSRRGVADLGAALYRRATCRHNTHGPSSHWTCPGGPSCTMLFLGRHDWRASSRSGLLISSTALWCPRRASA